MKPLFTWEDFKALKVYSAAGDMADIANKKVEEWLKDAVRVYNNERTDVWSHFPNTNHTDTHTALLVNIEWIQKGVSVEEIVDQLREVHVKQYGSDDVSWMSKLADRLEREGVKGQG